MNDFTATSPIATRHKRASRAISREVEGENKERERERDSEIVAHICDYTSVQNRERTSE